MTVQAWSSSLGLQPVGGPPLTPPFALPLKGSMGSMTIVPAPWRSTSYAIRMEISDNELNLPVPPGRTPPSSSPGHPCCAVTGPHHALKEGDDGYVSWKFWLDPSFPIMQPASTTERYFMLLGELHGPVVEAGHDVWEGGFPFGTPATALCCDVYRGQEVLCLKRGYPHWDVIWATPLVRGVLQRVTLHVVFSANPNAGLREVWYQSTRQKFVDGRLSWAGDNTLRQDPDDGYEEQLEAFAMIYYGPVPGYGEDDLLPVIVYHGNMKTGGSYSSVQ